MASNAHDLNFSFSDTKSVSMVFSLRPYNPINATLAYHGKPLPIVSTATYLGVTLDSKLLWNQHISKLLRNVGPCLNFLKMLSPTQWGGDPSILTLFYKSTIRSKIDYASSLYGSASKTQLQRIEHFQNKCLRLIIGALNSTPIPALNAETGVHPLQYRRNYLTDRILTRFLSSRPTIISDNILFLLSHWRFTEHKLPLICKRAKLIFPFKKFILCHNSYCLSPFTYHQILYKRQFHILPKLTTTNATHQTLFLSFTHQHFPHHLHIFTDGYKNQYGVGAAVWIPSKQFSASLSLPPFTSIFHAEQTAIFRAISLIQQNYTSGHFLIISDSMAALHSLSHISSQSKNSLALPIMSLIISLTDMKIDFLWIPSHTGITNNEIVDTIAKTAHSTTSSFKNLPISELLSTIQKSTNDDWASQYHGYFTTQNSQYLLIQPYPPLFPWYKQFPRTNRSLIIKLSRLRFGHNRLPPHLKRLQLTQSDLCPFHTDFPTTATLEHIFFQCPELHNIRQNLYTAAINLNIQTPFSANTFLSIENITLFPHILQFIKNLPPSFTASNFTFNGSRPL